MMPSKTASAFGLVIELEHNAEKLQTFRAYIMR
ncbi:hypothetical protein MPC1_4620002 [Methylocella tundrae]|nr:hypothetical protein MPC1_4620002 [Methylocella tundrae]